MTKTLFALNVVGVSVAIVKVAAKVSGTNFAVLNVNFSFRFTFCCVNKLQLFRFESSTKISSPMFNILAHHEDSGLACLLSRFER